MSSAHKNSNKLFPQNGTTVEVKNNNVGQAMKKLKQLVQREGIFKELRERRFFEKPSVKRKKARAAARKRWLKELAKNDESM